MPNCFQLISKESGEAEYLNKVDDKIRIHLGIEPNEETFYGKWYSIIGLRLACGESWEEILSSIVDPELHKVAQFLSKNYDVNAWKEI